MLAKGRAFLIAKGLDEGRLEAELLVARSLEMDRLRLFLSLDRPVDKAEVDRARELLVRRAAGEPVAYLTGTREFYGRPFSVGPGVLVPRPETEHIVDRARELFSDRAELRIGDFGTGSGCLAITLALELNAAYIVATDVSPEALGYAIENAAALGAESVRFELGDGPEALGELAEGGFDLVVSNPPYVDPETKAELADDVRTHEPAGALFAPAGDLDHWVRRLVAAAPSLLRAGGTLLVELGIGRAESALEIASQAGFEAKVHKDYAGIGRVLEVRDARPSG